MPICEIQKTKCLEFSSGQFVLEGDPCTHWHSCCAQPATRCRSTLSQDYYWEASCRITLRTYLSAVYGMVTLLLRFQHGWVEVEAGIADSISEKSRVLTDACMPTSTAATENAATAASKCVRQHIRAAVQGHRVFCIQGWTLSGPVR